MPASAGFRALYTHASEVCGCDMTFAVYLPPQAQSGKVPVLWYLSGLTCTHENAMTKGGLQEHAARCTASRSVYPDTSPRGDDVANDEAYDLGQGAGFYVNATRSALVGRISRCMLHVVSRAARTIVHDNFPVSDRHGITGHSMGGHGALTIALTATPSATTPCRPSRRSPTRPNPTGAGSSLAPISAMTKSAWQAP